MPPGWTRDQERPVDQAAGRGEGHDQALRGPAGEVPGPAGDRPSDGLGSGAGPGSGARRGPLMAEQKKKETRPTKPEGGDDAASANPELAKKGKKIKEDLDNLLDEIDAILEG